MVNNLLKFAAFNVSFFFGWKEIGDGLNGCVVEILNDFPWHELGMKPGEDKVSYTKS